MRARHAAAVPEQVVERLVAGPVDVGEAAVDQLAERGERHREPRSRVGQRDEHRVASSSAAVRRSALRRGVHLDARRLELRRLLGGGQVAVADVVDPPGERVDGGERAPLGRRQQPDAVGEVPGLLPGDPLALRRTPRRRPRSPPLDVAAGHVRQRVRLARLRRRAQHIVAGLPRSPSAPRGRRPRSRRWRAAPRHEACRPAARPRRAAAAARFDLERHERDLTFGPAAGRARSASVTPKRSMSSRGR